MHAPKKESSTGRSRRFLPLFALWILLASLISVTGPGALAAVESENTSQAQSTDRNAFIQKVVKLQMPFIANQGQLKDKNVRFYARTFGGTAYITARGDIVYSFTCADSRTKAEKRSFTAKDIKLRTLKESLIGALTPALRGIGSARTRVNYFIGNDKSKWRTNIPAYHSINLGEIAR